MSDSFENGYALLIGVGRSLHTAWSLPATARDVSALERVLTNPDHCAYRPSQVSPLVNEAATRSRILKELANLARSAATNPNLTVIIYYSGHGWLRKGEKDQYFLIPHDVEPDTFKDKALSAGRFTEALKEIPAQRLLVILDTCHAEGMASPAKVPSEPSFVPAPKGFSRHAPLRGDIECILGQGSGRAVLASCQGTESSWICPVKEVSIFTHHLIEALKGAGSRAAERVVRVNDLCDFVSEEVERTARSLGYEQTPFFKFEGKNLFPIALNSRSLTDLLDNIPDLASVKESWIVLLDSLRVGRLTSTSTPPPEVISATRHILSALAVAPSDPQIEKSFLWKVLEVHQESTDLSSIDGLAHLYLEVGYILSSAGRFESAFRAHQTCRRLLEKGKRVVPVSESLRALQDGLVNCEAVAMRDEFQPHLALDYLSDYGIPRYQALLYPEVCVLGTKAQVLTYLAEIEKEATIAQKYLEDAEELLRHTIAYFEGNPEKYERELPREYNYLGALYGAGKSIAQMDAQFEVALELNDQWFEKLPVQEQSDLRGAWIGNFLFTFQLWLRYYELHGDRERFVRIDRRYEQQQKKIILATGEWNVMDRFERRYPAALITRYRARSWARELSQLRGSPVWTEKVSQPLLEVHEVFTQRQPIKFLAAAALVDILLLVDLKQPEVRMWVERLESLLSEVVRSSREHWRYWQQREEGKENSLYREPFTDELRNVRSFLNNNGKPLADLYPSLRELRARLAY